jgi:hypothetical protein
MYAIYTSCTACCWAPYKAITYMVSFNSQQAQACDGWSRCSWELGLSMVDRSMFGWYQCSLSSTVYISKVIDGSHLGQAPPLWPRALVPAMTTGAGEWSPRAMGSLVHAHRP